MKYEKAYLRNISLLARKKKYSTEINFNFNLIFKLIKKNFYKKKIIIAGYYPSNYEVDILNFLYKASKKNLELYYLLLNLQIKCLSNHGSSKSHFI